MSGQIIFILAVAFGFYMAWNIGANDVANAMGTSVGSGALKIKKAALIAGVMNFLGALLVGTHVTNTVRKGVVDPEYFASEPIHLMIGMLGVMLAAGLWVMFATYKQWPVSTTHSIIGAVVGFGIAAGGMGIIKWKVILFIVMSWIISPVFGGCISYIVFMTIRKLILHRKHPFKAALLIGPGFTGVITYFLAIAFLFKGLKNLKLNLTLLTSSLISLLLSVIVGGIVYILLKRVERKCSSEIEDVERLAIPLQIVSASYEAFAAGANDVANAIGPVAAILAILDTGSVTMEASVPIWLLAMGGIGIWIGISTWGWRVMATIGKKITHITPTRGFAAEFGTATTVLICSQLGMPVSTTHTSVGNVIGVGMAGGVSSIDIRVVWKIIEGWLWTLPVAGIMSAIFYKILCLLFQV